MQHPLSPNPPIKYRGYFLVSTKLIWKQFKQKFHIALSIPFSLSKLKTHKVQEFDQ